uniref:Protein phosphatase 1 regulatory subunit 12B n=1 Tax=Drosophila melanogaster TaxID=7227 RepID=Q9VUX6_DROME|nr:myosin binding subunit, isoform K [Drosophila melanogaster]AAF49547.3 myosin binding subunit, isoform K [Drosophila melanogaster]|eukprot:NP_730100.2 myosin binding subunit, isoform K [Drosophila melanogaster]
MSSLDARNNSAMMKRAEQLKRWEESDTNRAAPTPRHEHGRRIKFSSGCVFLAACLSGDKDEVVQLLDQGADINTANVDGLTALHQACIDDNLDMVEFLVERGADINRQDNEGWTPLHATASCGFVSIARYLVENGADVAAVNSDGDLALDLAIDVQHMAMIDYMEKMVQELNINVDEARKAEELAMLNDAKKWLRSDAAEVDRPHPKTGATALHVAAAKGYTKVLGLLLAGRGNVDRQDNDGWTPLHAASHWGQRETAEMLVESLADMDIRNYAGQSCIDVADRKIVKFLEELRANKRNKRRPSSQIRISDAMENHVEKTPTKLVRVEVRTDATKDAASGSSEATEANSSIPNAAADDNNDDDGHDDVGGGGEVMASGQSDTEELSDSTESSHLTSLSESEAENVKPNQQIHAVEHPVEEEAPWRRKLPRTPSDSPTNNQVPDRELGTNSSETANDVILRRTQSFENDQKKPTVTIATSTAATAINSPSTTVQTPPIRRSFVPPVRDEESETQRKAHAKRVRETRRSTQGVTLDEIKSAEELVKKKNMGMANNNNNNNISTTTTNTISNSGFKLEDITSGGTYPPNNSTIIPSAPAVMAAANLSTTTGVQRRISSGPIALNASNQSLNSVGRPVSAPSEGTNNSAYVTPSARKFETNATSTGATTAATTTSNSTSNSVSATSANHTTATAPNATSNHDDKDNDKENDNRTQTVIQRRRKPKRRSTGVVHIDMDELDPERQNESSNNDNEEKEKESGSERTSRSRLGSTASTATTSESKSSSSNDKTENGDGIDYKALWEAEKLENDKLRQMLKQKDDEAVQTRATLERFANAQLDAYKSDNHRLKEENAALIRVISKLSK